MLVPSSKQLIAGRAEAEAGHTEKTKGHLTQNLLLPEAEGYRGTVGIWWWSPKEKSTRGLQQAWKATVTCCYTSGLSCLSYEMGWQ